MVKKLLPKVLWITLGAAALVAASFAVVELKRYINTVKDDVITNGIACVVHKSKPVQLPHNHLIIFIRRDGGEFYLMDKDLYDRIDRGDCVRYRYHEYREYNRIDGPKKYRITGYGYDIQYMETKLNESESDQRA